MGGSKPRPVGSPWLLDLVGGGRNPGSLRHPRLSGGMQEAQQLRSGSARGLPYQRRRRELGEANERSAKNVHTCVLRDGMTADTMDPAGLYFGTTTGEVYRSSDGGESWSNLLRGVGRVQGVSA